MIHSIGMILLFFVQWLISTILVRMGGYYETGIFSLGMTIANVFAYIGNFGIRTFMLADTNENYTQDQYKGAGILAIIGSYICCLGYLMIFGHYTTVEWIAILLYLTYMNFIFYSDILFGRIQLCGRLELNGFSNIIRSLLCFFAFVLSYVLFHSILISLCCMALSSGIVLFTFDSNCYYNVTKEKAFRGFAQIGKSKKVLVKCVPIMLTLTLPLITNAIPRETIQREFGTELLGYFSTVFTPAVLISVIFPNILQGILPDLAHSWNSRNIRNVKKLIGIEVGVVLSLTGVSALLAYFFGKPIMRLVFGEEILQYYSLLYYAIITIGVNSLVGIGNNVLIAMSENNQLPLTNIFAIVVCFIFSRCLIHRYHLYGATYVLIIAYSSQVVLQSVMILTRYSKEKCKWK